MQCRFVALIKELGAPLRYLLRHPEIRTAHEALAIVTQYFDEDQLPLKTRLALEEMLA